MKKPPRTRQASDDVDIVEIPEGKGLLESLMEGHGEKVPIGLEPENRRMVDALLLSIAEAVRTGEPKKWQRIQAAYHVHSGIKFRYTQVLWWVTQAAAVWAGIDDAPDPAMRSVRADMLTSSLSGLDVRYSQLNREWLITRLDAQVIGRRGRGNGGLARLAAELTLEVGALDQKQRGPIAREKQLKDLTRSFNTAFHSALKLPAEELATALRSSVSEGEIDSDKFRAVLSQRDKL